MTKKNVVVVGAQIGDEGKAKIIDYLAQDVKVVVRFQGGANAGHTIWVNDKKTVCHLIPSGILHSDIINVIATSVVVDPFALLEEITQLQGQGVKITPDNLKIASNCAVVTPIHKAIDVYEEEMRGKDKIGTTHRGIGPVNVDKVARRGLRLYDLTKAGRLERLMPIEQYSLLAKKYSLTYTYEQFVSVLYEAGKKITPYLTDTSLFLDRACQTGGVLFEGAQAALLDVDHGSYPYVTSSHCVAGYASVGSGISPLYIDEIIGVVKAYTTRVGTGPFPTELSGESAEKLRQKGSEFGATTGRPRRIGWLDLVALKYAVRIHGLTSIAITKLDTLSGLDELKICTHYTINDRNFEEMPVDHLETTDAIPNYVTLKGWKQDISQINDICELPKEVANYISFIVDALGVSVTLVGIGPDRKQTLLTKKNKIFNINELLADARRDIVLDLKL